MSASGGGSIGGSIGGGGGAWGGPVVTASAAAAAVKLHDVMDEELASKLQREEEAQWEREIAGRFGDERRGGWCFVEVPSADCELGVMSVIQQEISVESERERDELREDDPDYAFALELQAQEAEEYDRMRRQQASSMERIRVIHHEDPHRGEIQKTLERYYSSDGQLVFEGVREDADELGDGPAAAAAAAAGDEFRVVPMAEPVATVAAAHLERLHLRDMDIHRDIYIDGDDFGLPRKKMDSLSAALKQSDRKHRRAKKTAPFKQA